MRLTRTQPDSFLINFPNAIRLDGEIREAVSDRVIDEVILPAAGEQGFDIGGPPNHHSQASGTGGLSAWRKRTFPPTTYSMR